MRIAGLLAILVLTVTAASGCVGRYAPDGPAAATDVGALGCQVGPQPGATVRDGDPLAPGEPMAGVPVTTLTPRAVGDLAVGHGLKVTWRYSYGISGGAGAFPNGPVPLDTPALAPSGSATPAASASVGEDSPAEVTPKPGGAAAGGAAFGFSECWCEPPPDGHVSGVAYGMASELVVFVESDRVAANVRDQPTRGWGC